MIRPVNLQPGDTIALVSPAKAIEPAFIDHACAFFEAKGFTVAIAEHAKGTHHYFSGTDEERAADMQWAIDHPDVKAIVCNRGGYGAIRLLELVQWANFMREPKWLLGFSDITNFHCQALKLGIESVHSSMPLNFQENSSESLDSIVNILKTGKVQHTWHGEVLNRSGVAEGIVVGGNLSILYSLLGTPLCPDFEGAILFFEDLCEQVYHVDRMLQAFKLAGVFEQISGLIVGGMTDMKETAVPTGWKIDELILDQLKYRSIPVSLNAPIGHIPDNRAVICGRSAVLTVTDERVTFIQS